MEVSRRARLPARGLGASVTSTDRSRGAHSSALSIAIARPVRARKQRSNRENTAVPKNGRFPPLFGGGERVEITTNLSTSSFRLLALLGAERGVYSLFKTCARLINYPDVHSTINNKIEIPAL